MGSRNEDRMEGLQMTGSLLLVFSFGTGVSLAQILVTEDCPVCVNVDPLQGQAPDPLAGVYNFRGESDECPGGCSYNREDDRWTVYCFGEGARTAKLECTATSPWDGIASATVGAVTENSGAETKYSEKPAGSLTSTALEVNPMATSTIR